MIDHFPGVDFQPSHDLRIVLYLLSNYINEFQSHSSLIPELLQLICNIRKYHKTGHCDPHACYPMRD